MAKKLARRATEHWSVGRWRWLSYILPPLVLAAALGASWLVREQALKEIERTLQTDFDTRIRETVGIFRERIQQYEQMLHAAEGLYAASVSVEQDEFKAFVGSLRIDRLPGLQGIGYVRALHGDRADASEALYFDPASRQLSIPGTDYFAEPSRRQAMATARDSGMVAIANKKKLPEEDTAAIQGGFRMYQPVYRNGSPRNTVAERRANLAGWVYAAFSMEGLMSNILGERADLVIDIYDGADMLDETQVFDSKSDRVGGESALKLLQGSQAIKVGSYSWTLSAHALPNFTTPLAIANLQLITRTGIATSVLLAFFTWLALRRKMYALRIKQQLDAAHEQLRESEELLKEAQHIAGLGSYVLDIPSGRWKGADSIPQMFGMDESHEQTYEAWAKLVHPDDHTMITDYFANLILTQNEVFDKGYRIIRHDNQAVRWLHGIGRLSFDAQGHPTKMLGTLRDITEQHEREAELAATHERLREIERRQTLSQERQRLVQDMHDGLGSSLVSALRVVEHGRMDEAEVAQVLKGCIDDLKLAIDSMEPVDADLLLLLATLRYRLGPRLKSTGIALRWEVMSVPKLDWLNPKSALHILRILQEAFTNIIKHTHATEIRVATRVESDHVVVTITDNGQGFAVENALKSGGKGLSNQMRRAEAIGAEVSWDSNDAGTCFTLRLPITRGPTIE